MNNISSISRIKKGETHQAKNFEFFIPDCKGKINGLELNADSVAVIPPRSEYSTDTGGLCAVIERAVLPFKKICTVCDKTGGIRSTAIQAENLLSSFVEANNAVLGALGNLLCAYACAFAELKLSPVVLLVKNDIENNLSNAGYALDLYLKKLPLNYDYIRKLFKKETGATPHEYLTAKRMQLAASILSSKVANTYSGYTVTQVSEICGYAEPLYFSRVFKNYYGVSPTNYAKDL